MRWLGVWTLLYLLLAWPHGASAHGGAVRLADAVVGPYKLTVRAGPGPLRTTRTDVSVLARDGSGVPVQDASVVITATPPRAATARYAAEPPAKPGDPYHAIVSFSSSGRWTLTVLIDGPRGAGEITLTAQVSRSILGATPGELFVYVGLPAVTIIVLKVFFSLRQRAERRRTLAPRSGGEGRVQPG